MVYTGRVQNGVVVLEDGQKLPDGTVVRVEPIEAAEDQTPTLYEQLESVIGIADGLPHDLAENHDHYLHGLPKK